MYCFLRTLGGVSRGSDAGYLPHAGYIVSFVKLHFTAFRLEAKCSVDTTTVTVTVEPGAHCELKHDYPVEVEYRKTTEDPAPFTATTLLVCPTSDEPFYHRFELVPPKGYMITGLVSHELEISKAFSEEEVPQYKLKIDDHDG